MELQRLKPNSRARPRGSPSRTFSPKSRRTSSAWQVNGPPQNLSNAEVYQMIEQFTAPEINLIGIFNTASRNRLISQLVGAMPDFSDAEMLEIAQTALNKVEKLADAEFAALEFYPEYGDKQPGKKSIP
jgi:hypothetical protein